MAGAVDLSMPAEQVELDDSEEEDNDEAAKVETAPGSDTEAANAETVADTEDDAEEEEGNVLMPAKRTMAVDLTREGKWRIWHSSASLCVLQACQDAS